MHETGHVFHFFDAFQHQNLIWNHHSPMEFAEVASMFMEPPGMPYWNQNGDGVYDEGDYRRAVVHRLTSIVTFLPYMAVVDKFQHWFYAAAPEAVSADDMDTKWAQLRDHFLPDINYSGLEVEKTTGWQRKSHIPDTPSYYIGYGPTQMGALQAWRNALVDQEQAVKNYHRPWPPTTPVPCQNSSN